MYGLQRPTLWPNMRSHTCPTGQKEELGWGGPKLAHEGSKIALKVAYIMSGTLYSTFLEAELITLTPREINSGQ